MSAWTFHAPRGIYVNPEFEYDVRCTALGVPLTAAQGSPIGSGIAITYRLDALQTADPPAGILAGQLSATPASEWEEWEIVAMVPSSFGNATTLCWLHVQGMRIAPLWFPPRHITGTQVQQALKTMGYFGGNSVPAAPPVVVPFCPKTKKEAEEALEALLDLDEGLLSLIYRTLYEGRNLRIDSAKRAAAEYLKGLPA